MTVQVALRISRLPSLSGELGQPSISSLTAWHSLFYPVPLFQLLRSLNQRTLCRSFGQMQTFAASIQQQHVVFAGGHGRVGEGRESLSKLQSCLPLLRVSRLPPHLKCYQHSPPAQPAATTSSALHMQTLLLHVSAIRCALHQHCTARPVQWCVIQMQSWLPKGS